MALECTPKCITFRNCTVTFENVGVVIFNHDLNRVKYVRKNKSGKWYTPNNLL